MREGMRAKDSKIPEAELEHIMANADVNGDGKVDYEEFLAATMHLGKLEREEHLYKAFKVRLGVLDVVLQAGAAQYCQRLSAGAS
jgi:Ca2+-binding EF-hand superfamily protein